MTATHEFDALRTDFMSVILIGPDEGRREVVASRLEGLPCRMLREFTVYPQIDELSGEDEFKFDAAMIDLDSSPEEALDLVENLCATSQATVMVYSADSDPDLMIRCMQAGAREFLMLPIDGRELAEAIVRASVRRAPLRAARKTDGALSVFWGAKGGAGVTTIAINFAILAARESGRRVLFIDLDLPLGDAGLQLGLAPQYSTVDALLNFKRLDGNFLSRLVVKDDSGLFVLAAPGKFAAFHHSAEAVNRLLHVARQQFDFVVVDSGSNLELTNTSLFDSDANIYLVSRVAIAELRNSNRIVTELFTANLPRLQIILNRFTPSSLGVDEEHVTRALTRKAQWQIPEDTTAARRMQANSTPLALGDNSIARAIAQMARAAVGTPAETGKKKKFMGLF